MDPAAPPTAACHLRASVLADAIVVRDRITAWGGTGWILSAEGAVREAFRARPETGVAALLMAIVPSGSAELHGLARAAAPAPGQGAAATPEGSDDDESGARHLRTRDDLATALCTVQWFKALEARLGGIAWSRPLGPLRPWKLLLDHLQRAQATDPALLAWLRREPSASAIARAEAWAINKPAGRPCGFAASANAARLARLAPQPGAIRCCVAS